MYTTCLFCHGALGANEVIERFPVGRCLAFDVARGRLWVVCPKCRQWNLSPLDERWEAIEDCERTFRDTRRRLSTDQIGLAKTAEGLDLVRIGEPQRPEFAAWRYGGELGRRRRRAITRAAIGVGAVGAALGGLVAAGSGLLLFGDGAWYLGKRLVEGSPNEVMARLDVPLEGQIIVRRKHLRHIHLLGDADGWQLGVPHRKRLVRLEGREAIATAGKLLPRLNHYGGKGDRVRRAVALLEAEPDPMRFFGRMAAQTRRSGNAELGNASYEARLALEMAAHEETERRAMEGELAALEQAWKEAEEIAAIADDMFLPTSIADWVKRHRPGSG